MLGVDKGKTTDSLEKSLRFDSQIFPCLGWTRRRPLTHWKRALGLILHAGGRPAWADILSVADQCGKPGVG